MLVIMTIQDRHREIVEVARRIVKRHHSGRQDIAAELIMRSLASSDADGTRALALALTEQALKAVEESRLEAATNGTPWQPAYVLASGELVTPADTSTAPIPLAMRMADALHRAMGGEQGALDDLQDVYEQAASADDQTFHGMFAALATYASYGLAGRVEYLTEAAP